MQHLLKTLHFTESMVWEGGISTKAVLDLLPQVSDERSAEVNVKIEKPRIVP